MSSQFFNRPILNSPYLEPTQHWQLDESGQPTHHIEERRRPAQYITPIPKPRKRKGTGAQDKMVFDEGKGLSNRQQEYDPTPIINQVRERVAAWRRSPNPREWGVTPETARLLQHWRTHQFSNQKPFFCQLEAVETAIWLSEVAPTDKHGKAFLERLKSVNEEANPQISRLALKLATGAGKTTVMAMLIAWQTINAARYPQSKKFTRGFLIIAPGLTIKDRLRVLMPNDPNSYYQSRELVPIDLLPEVDKAVIVITNYQQFKLRERMEVSKGGRSLLQGRGDELQTLETEGQMLQRVLPDLMNLKGIMVVNDEAHHCYREKPGEAEDDEDLKGDDRKEAEKNLEAARLWISGIEAAARKIGVLRVMDLSATPFFLSGSGYAEGTLFPWTMSDFSLMDAIECGIVKLPRVPVADNIPGAEVPMYRNLWEHIRAKMPKSGRAKGGALDPSSLPVPLLTAFEALYGHYEKTFELWKKEGIRVPPCFIVVCNNTATSKLVYDYIGGFRREHADGSAEATVPGRFSLFSNYDANGNPLPRPNTLLIDSEQLESGDALDDNFRAMAGEEIERFRREILERGGKQAVEIAGNKDVSDAMLLREVMNTVGKHGQLGEGIRCVVSVSMLTEGWDANTVTHVLGVRAFGTQLLCEQVIGRALRRQSYELNEQGLFDVEYADVLGIPFDFTAKPQVAAPAKPKETINVKAIKPDRDDCEIRFPRVLGYRLQAAEERITAAFTDDSRLELTPDLVGATETQNSGIIGEQIDLSIAHMKDVRESTVLFHLTKHLLTKMAKAGGEQELSQFGTLKRIAREWLTTYLICKGGTYPGQLQYTYLADLAAERILAAINRGAGDGAKVSVVLDPYNPLGSTMHVNFNTSKTDRWQTGPEKCHINWVIHDSTWEAEFCRFVERHRRVRAYVKNHNLGFEVPYTMGGEARVYRPDFIVRIDDGQGEDDLLNLVVEVKGYRGEDAKHKKETMEQYWLKGVNNAKTHGRWAFAEFSDVYAMEIDFAKKVEAEVNRMIEQAIASHVMEQAIAGGRS